MRAGSKGVPGNPPGSAKQGRFTLRTNCFVLLACIAFMMSGCASLMPGESSRDANKSLAPTAGGYIERQEAELVQRMTHADGTSIQREQDKLCITFSCGVLFPDDSTELKPDAPARIAPVAEVLAKYPATSIKVDGFTDRTGSEKYDHEVTESRATAVRNVLVGKGIDPARIRARGFGDSKPLTTNATDEGRRTNRRVTITITPL